MPAAAALSEAAGGLSPCVGVCRLEADGYCLGCWRHSDEITAWAGLSVASRRRIISELPARWVAGSARWCTHLAPTLHPLDQPLSTLPLHAPPVPEVNDRRRPAAVLVPLVLTPEPGILLTVRQADLPHHAGQVAFPGGSAEMGDAGAVATALREAEEEIGLPAEQVRPLGYLDRIETLSGFRLTPVVGLVETLPELRLAAAEVAAAFVLPLKTLFEHSAFTNRDHVSGGCHYRLPELHYQNWRIWGASALILAEFRGRFAAAGLTSA